MGQEILYCAKCARRLTTGDFEKGLGIRVGAKVSCTDCLQDLVSLSPEEQRDFAKEVAQRRPAKSEPKRGSTVQIPIVKAPRKSFVSTRSPMSGLLLALAGIGGVLLLVVLLMSGDSEQRKPPPVPAPRNPTEESASTRAAREAVERARKSSPGDVDAQIAAWAQAIPATQGTSYAREATEMHQGLLDLRKSAHAKEILELDARTAPLLDREDFVAAGELLEGARRRHNTPEWGTLIEARLRTLRARADSLFVSIVQKASDARLKGLDEEVKAARDRVARWRRPDLAAELERTLATAVPAAPTPAAASERPWKPIFDGKTLEFMTKESRQGWEVQDGAIFMKTPNAIQSRELFGDGEFRFRFEARDVDVIYIGVRRAAPDGYRVEWKTRTFRPLEGKLCELIFTCKGDSVTAQVNGEAVEITANGRPARGSLTFSARAKLFRILSVDVRTLP